MNTAKKVRALLAILAISATFAACKQSASQKVEDKAEDAAHEVNQATERAGENVEKAVK